MVIAVLISLPIGASIYYFAIGMEKRRKKLSSDDSFTVSLSFLLLWILYVICAFAHSAAMFGAVFICMSVYSVAAAVFHRIRGTLLERKGGNPGGNYFAVTSFLLLLVTALFFAPWIEVMLFGFGD